MIEVVDIANIGGSLVAAGAAALVKRGFGRRAAAGQEAFRRHLLTDQFRPSVQVVEPMKARIRYRRGSQTIDKHVASNETIPLDTKSKRHWIVGEAGSGKTFQATRVLNLRLKQGRTAVFTRARWWSDGGTVSLESCAVNLANRNGFQVHTALALLNSAKTLVVVDGLDEQNDTETQEQLELLIKELPGEVLVTSRFSSTEPSIWTEYQLLLADQNPLLVQLRHLNQRIT
jgi:hypothetical protein